MTYNSCIYENQAKNPRKYSHIEPICESCFNNSTCQLGVPHPEGSLRKSIFIGY